jgi:signal transduction histidine kinase
MQEKRSWPTRRCAASAFVPAATMLVVAALGLWAPWRALAASAASGAGPVYATALLALVAVVAVVGVSVYRTASVSPPVARAARSAAALPAPLVDAVDSAVLACDAAGRGTVGNDAARRLFRADAAAPGGWAPAVDFLDTDGLTPLPPERLPLTRVLREGAVRGVELIAAPPDAPRRWLVASGRRTPAGAVVVLHDVTAVREAEQGLRAAHAATRAANAELTASVERLEAFAGAVSHDLKSPLATITGYLQLLPHAPAAEQEELLAGVGDAVRRASAAVDAHLAYAAADRSRLDVADVDLVTLVADVVAPAVAFRRRAGEPVPTVTVDPLPPVSADAGMLRQVVENLVGNALKYARPGKPAEVHVTARRAGAGWVQLEVADRGVGVPEDEREAIFGGFHRAHRSGGPLGTGLGLSICRRIVERHGGSIGCRPNPGGGTRFWVVLPAAHAERGGVPEQGRRDAVPA